MLSETKPKKMAFSIENLARSSHDEPKPGRSDLSTPPPNPSFTFSQYPPLNFDPPHSSDGFNYGASCFSTPDMPTVPLRHRLVVPYSAERDVPLKLPLVSPTDKTQVKRKREDSCDSGVESPSPNRSRHTSEASFSSNSSYTTDIDENGEELQKRKKARTAFSTEQVYELEKRYQAQKYLPANERNALADKLGLSDQQVKTWFQNRRMKEKRQQRDDEHARTFSLPTGGVDVTQLVALGLPCPPPYNVSDTSFSQLPGMTRVPQYHVPSPSGHFPSVLPYPGSVPMTPVFPHRQQFQVPFISHSPQIPAKVPDSRVSVPERTGV